MNKNIELLNGEIRINGTYVGTYKIGYNRVFSTFFDTSHSKWNNVSAYTLDGLKKAILNEINNTFENE